MEELTQDEEDQIQRINEILNNQTITTTTINPSIVYHNFEQAFYDPDHIHPTAEGMVEADRVLGPGILEQLPEPRPYQRLNLRRLAEIVGATFEQSPPEPHFTIWTGAGGRRDFDRAMREEASRYGVRGSEPWSIIEDNAGLKWIRESKIKKEEGYNIFEHLKLTNDQTTIS